MQSLLPPSRLVRDACKRPNIRRRPNRDANASIQCAAHNFATSRSDSRRLVVNPEYFALPHVEQINNRVNLPIVVRTEKAADKTRRYGTNSTMHTASGSIALTECKGFLHDAARVRGMCFALSPSRVIGAEHLCPDGQFGCQKPARDQHGRNAFFPLEPTNLQEQ